MGEEFGQDLCPKMRALVMTKGDSSMNDSNGESRNDGPTARPARRRWKTAAVLVTVFFVGAASGGVMTMATDAWSHGGKWGGSKGENHSPEAMKERMHRRADRLLDRIDATDEQREAIMGIVDEVAEDFAGGMDAHRALRGEWRSELERPELDAEALEALRVRHVQLVDEKSRRLLDVVVRAGSVLTVEQRGELLERFSRFGGRHHHHRHGHKRRGESKG